MKVSICIACHNQAHFLKEAIESCFSQDYKNLNVVVLDDASADGTNDLLKQLSKSHSNLIYLRSPKPSGSGGAFNKAIEKAKENSDVIVLLCSDDFFTCNNVISDIVKRFLELPKEVHVSRYYHQFEDGDRRPVRAWRSDDVIELANNPSGLAFRSTALEGLNLTNKMFVEAPTLVAEVCKKGFWSILPYDTVAVRIHQSTARSKEYYAKMWTTSPVEEWAKIGGEALLRDYTSLVQIKNYFSTRAVIQECKNFIRLRPINLITPAFIFFSVVSILTPRSILINVPHWYRITFGRWFTREVKREA